MFKKITSLMFALLLATVGVISVTPAEASENSASPASTQLLVAADTAYAVVYSRGAKQDYVFHSEGIEGYIFRGYLAYEYTTSDGRHVYSGVLYREPLPYPIP